MCQRRKHTRESLLSVCQRLLPQLASSSPVEQQHQDPSITIKKGTVSGRTAPSVTDPSSAPTRKGDPPLLDPEAPKSASAMHEFRAPLETSSSSSSTSGRLSFVPRRRPRRGPPPPKTTIAASLMLVGGIILLGIGGSLRMDSNPKERERGLAMLILGAIIFIPGSYASTQLYGAYMGWPGYDYCHIPSYDE